MAKPDDLPALLVAAASDRLGAAVVAAEPLRGGFTPQRLYRLLLADGRSAILKAAPPNPAAQGVIDWATGKIDWSSILRQEVRAYEALRVLAPWQPAFLRAFERVGWVALLLEDLAAATPIPRWTDATVDIVARDLAALHAATRDEPPTGLGPDTLVEPFFDKILARGRRLGRLPPTWDGAAGWAWLEQACHVGATAMATGFGDVPAAVVHGDVRSDNMFLRAGRLVLIDWPAAHWDSVARESVYWALGVEAEGGETAPRAHARYLGNAGPLPERAIVGALARQCGYFLDRLQAGMLGEALIAYFRSMLRPTVAWFAQALDLPAPPGW